METWEAVLVGVLVLLLLWWLRPGMKAMLENSRRAPKDWPGVIVPLVLVILFVLFLIAVV